MRYVLFVVCLSIPCLGFGQAKPFDPIKSLEGKWEGTGEGQSGTSKVARSYEFLMNGQFLHGRNTSEFAPQAKNPTGEKHEDWSIYSYDKGRKKLVLRQFHVEGFVNQYVLDSVSADGKEIVFLTEAIENIPAGFRARETYRMAGPDSLEEKFEIAPPGKDFEIYSTSKLTRVK